MLGLELPCNRDEAVETLDEFIEWLGQRNRVTVAFSAAIIAGSLYFLAQGPPLLSTIAGLSALLIAILTLWVVRGNRDLAVKAARLRDAIRAGTVGLDDYCGIALVAAVVAYDLRSKGARGIAG